MSPRTVHETNGRIKLSWQQITWGVSVIVLLLASWYDSRTQIALAISRLDGRVANLEKTLTSQQTYSKAEVDLMMERTKSIFEERLSRISALEKKVYGRAN